MEKELELELMSVLEGIDAEELLADKPLLAAIALDIGNFCSEEEVTFDQVNDERLAEVSDDIVCSTDDDANSDESNSGDSVKGNKFIKQVAKENNKRNHTCQACNGPSRGRKYMGGLVCLSCRAFFVRSVKDDACKKFTCNNVILGLDSCEINSKSWKSCQSCRFEGCLKAGMIIPDNDKAAIVAKNSSVNSIRAYSMLRDRLKTATRTEVWKCLMNTSGLSATDMTLIEAFPDIDIDLKMKIFPDMARSNMNQVKEWLGYFYQKDSNYFLYMQKSMDDYQRFHTKELFLRQSGYPWNSMKKSDRAKLVKENGPLILEYYIANRIGKPSYNVQMVQQVVEVLVNDPDQDFRRQVSDVFKEVSQNGTLLPSTATYESIYNKRLLGLKSREALERHKLAAKKLSQVTLAGNVDHHDHIAQILTVGILLHTTDFLELDDPKSVEDVQALYASLLWRYLKGLKTSQRETLLRDSMLASSYARELRKTREQAYQKGTKI